ncbi:hypothetical protein [Staphylococcus gallinarum]|uniref:hypothetical protein n=1 Tax=Staphylococcus gallinarum TaxID=1293 RepID=UPI0030BDC36D
MIVFTKKYLLEKCITYNNENQIIDLNNYIKDEISTSKVEPFFRSYLIDEIELQKMATKFKLTIIDKNTKQIIINK